MISSCVSLCSPLAMPGLDNELFAMVQSGQEQLEQLSLPAAERVYIGSESCDFLLCRNHALLADTAHKLIVSGLAVTLVTPPVSQFMLGEVLSVITSFDKEKLADEIVVNDLGLLCWCSENVKNMSIRAGRCFDKITREARFDAFTADEIGRNRALYETPYMQQNATGEYFTALGVRGIELDAVPQAVLDLSSCDWDFALWYPDIALSWCTTCEFAGSTLAAEAKFIPGHCACECTKYKTELHGESLMKITKSARMIEATEFRHALSCFMGECRIVLSTHHGRCRQ